MRRKREKGQTTAEFVVVLPFLLLLFFLIVDFGWLLKNWIVVTNSAREAARCTVAASCHLTSGDVEPDVLAEARITAGITGNLSNVSANPLFIDTNGNGIANTGESVVICVSADNDWIGPVIGLLNLISGSDVLPDPIPLRAREEMILENTSDYDNLTPSADGVCGFS